jgi:c-di-GMP-related signal transduction protein
LETGQEIDYMSKTYSIITNKKLKVRIDENTKKSFSNYPNEITLKKK